MYVCYEKVTTSWIVGDDDIYIMVECIYVCYEKVTTSWIVGDDDIYAQIAPGSCSHLSVTSLAPDASSLGSAIY